MQLEFNKTGLRFLGTAAQGVRNTEVTQEVRLPEGMPDIGRVLTAWGQVILRSKEWQGDAVTVTGGVQAWTLYAPEDGTEPRSLESWIPFQLRWETEQVNREGPVRVLPLLRFADSRSISSRKIMVRCGVAAMAQALHPMEAEAFAPEELPQDVEILEKTYPVRLHGEAGEKAFQMDEELPLMGTGQQEKMLCCTVEPVIMEKRVLADKLLLKGTAHIHLVCRNEEGRVHGMDLEAPFSQLSELDGRYDADALADVYMGVTGLEADLQEAGKLHIKCGMVAQYLIDRRELLEVVQDAYSPSRQVELQQQFIELPVVLEDRKETVTPEQNLHGQEGTAVDAVFYPDFPRQRQNGESTELEMTGLFRTLVYGEDGALQGVNARWEGRQSFAAAENSHLCVTAQMPVRVQVMPGVDGMHLTGQMQMNLQTEVRETIPMVSGLELGELRESDDNRPSAVLCSCGTQSLWELAKRCNSTVSAIQTANALEGEPEEGRMLLIPVL